MIDDATSEVVQDAVRGHRFDALVEISKEEPSVRAVVVVDLVRAMSALASDGMRVELGLRDVPDIRELRQLLIDAGAVADGIYPEITDNRSRGHAWQSATLFVGRAEISLTSKFEQRPYTRKRRARRKAA